MLIEDVEQLKVWLAASLSPITDVDPPALSKYVLALVKKEKSTEELKDSCIDQLDIFLQSKTKEFVEKLFDVLESKSYIVKPGKVIKHRPSTVSGSRHQDKKPSLSTYPGSKPKKFKHNQAPVVDRKAGKSLHRPGNVPASMSMVSPVIQGASLISGKRTVTSASKLDTTMNMELKNTSNTAEETPASRLSTLSPKAISTDLKEDWLDYVEMQETFEDSSEENTEELLCFRRKGRGCLEPRRVPRLPLRAMIQRMRMLDESFSSGRHSGGRGRARILQERARPSIAHGLHKKRTERVVASEKKEVFKTSPAMKMQVDRKEDLYNRHWQQDEFPSLGIEHTVNGSPRKGNKDAFIGAKQKGESESRKLEENIEEDDVNRTDPVVNCPDFQLNPVDNTEVVKPKNVKKKKFDFSKANQELLQEFPIHIVNQPGPKILSLTQHNLEKFLRESDSESCSSQENLHVSIDTAQENSKNLPVYQRYPVTLDDIRKSKASKVPPKVKGHLANLLEAMDTYCGSPETNIDNFDKRSKKSDNVASVSKVRASNNFEETSTELRQNPETSNIDLSKSNKRCTNLDATSNPLSSENLEGTLSNISVVSDLSSLNSPSDNDFEISNANVDEIKENTHTKVKPRDNIAECELELENDSKCNVDISNGTNDSNDESLGKRQSSPVKGELIVKEMNGVTGMDKTSKSDDIETFKKSGNIGQLDDIDLKTLPLTHSTQENLEGFQKVVNEQKRGKSPGDVQKTLNDVTNDQTVWRIYGRNVIQVDGLPEICDTSELHGMVAGFGTVVDFQERVIGNGKSVRFKLHNEDACEYAVQCLDETDCLFPDNNCKLKCHQLHI